MKGLRRLLSAGFLCLGLAGLQPLVWAQAAEGLQDQVEDAAQDPEAAAEEALGQVQEGDLAPATAAAVARLATDRFADLVDAIGELAALQDPDALPALLGLRDRRLYYDADATVFIADARDGTLREAATGALREDLDTAELQQPRLTNRVRRDLRPAIAALQINSEDVVARRAAANELAQRPQRELRGAIIAAIEREQQPDIERLLNIALAQLDLTSSDDERRLEAVLLVAEVRAARLRGALQQMTEQGPDGEYFEPVAEIREAAAAGVRAIDRRERLAGFLSDFVYGLSMGSVLLLAAMGLAIIFGLMGVINMAHGELLMIGAYATFLTQAFFAQFLPQLFHFYLIAAVPVAFLATAAVGIAMERGVIRFLYRRPLETLLATWGLSLILMQLVRMIFGAQNVAVSSPPWFSGSVQIMQGVSLSTSRLGVFFFAVFVVALVWFLMQRTRLGLEVRAVMQNRDMAAALGVPANRVDMWTFGVGAGVAGLGGVALSQIVNVGPELGQSYIVDSFMVVVLGGAGSLLGPVFSALGIGVTTKFLEPAVGAVLATILVFAAIILFIQWRPQGIFALKGRAADD